MIRKTMVVVAVVGAAFTMNLSSSAMAKPQTGSLPRTATTESWGEGPFTAADARTLIWRVSQAGKNKEHMNVDVGVINRGGIKLSASGCGPDDKWLWFVETAKTHVAGGKRCSGKRTFEQRSGTNLGRYSALLGHVGNLTFDEIDLDVRGTGPLRRLRSDGHRAALVFSQPAGGWKASSIWKVWIDGAEVSVQRHRGR